jgi:hypothetical protein
MTTWQELRDYWLPLMLFAGTLLIAAILLVLVAVMPFLAEHFPISNHVLALFAADVAVRRTSIAGAIGLIVTAWVFFRPKVLARKSSSEKPPGDTMAGA